MNNNQIVTRFAPSNTGNGGLHIGSLRTALYSWLYAKNNKAVCQLRIEDSDPSRSNKESLINIMEGFQWLGLQFDSGPTLNEIKNNIYKEEYFQSKRSHLYDKFVNKLLQEGKAFAQEDGSVIFKMPKEDYYIKDEIIGTVKFPQEQCQDFIIKRKDKTHTFHLSNPSDDILNGCTHLIKGNDHLSNAPKHISLFKALNFSTPKYIHLSLILDEFGKKLSKRRTDQSVLIKDFKTKGFLPEVILNYTAILGWNAGQEEFDLKYAIENFNLKNISISNARFDYKKLLRFNQNAICRMTKDEFQYRLIEYGKEYFSNKVNKLKDRFNIFIDLYHGKIKTLEDAFIGCEWLYDEIISNQNIIKIPADNLKILSCSYNYLEKCQNWNSDTIMETLKEVSKLIGISLGKVVQPIRLATTGQEISPPIDQVMLTLGKNVTLYRIKNNINVKTEFGQAA